MSALLPPHIAAYSYPTQRAQSRICTGTLQEGSSTWWHTPELDATVGTLSSWRQQAGMEGSRRLWCNSWVAKHTCPTLSTTCQLTWDHFGSFHLQRRQAPPSAHKESCALGNSHYYHLTSATHSFFWSRKKRAGNGRRLTGNKQKSSV